ncbi:MAG TPA: 3-hydroxyacyl-CoA dehydrogenase NAD-binding domain-containing protein [Candidatus Dormibacteraeota bacterium]|nr:3-hydroxyacyl-CoA dehydrogenase NAD-binding domain-containing protein [Candidatus Dormibacteraeota bacterium]
MRRRIEKAVVLGAGTMGARIAAHFVNAGLPCILLDIAPAGSVPGSKDRNKIVGAGFEAAKKSKPAAFFSAAFAEKVSIGNFEDDLSRVAEADWIIEVVAENLEIKRSLLQRVAQFRKPGTIVTTNTSGLPVHLIAEGMSEEFQENWCGTHFFNPPRYLKLVELIPGPKTSGDVLETLRDFCDKRLGKGVVEAKDTPNFIANRIGTFSMLNALRLMSELDMTVEEVDACTGPAVGWPKSATFRTADLVGLDVLTHVIKNIYETAPNDESHERYKVPALLADMTARGWLGDKTGQGFYKKTKEGKREILTLDVKKMEYRPKEKAKFASLEGGKGMEDTKERLRFLVGPILAGQKGDKAQQFLWQALSETCLYAAQRVPEIADSVAEVDRAMRWGFGWEMGPFEMMDAIGVKEFTAQVEKEGRGVPLLIERVASARKGFYETEKGATNVFDISGKPRTVSEPEGVIILKSLKDVGREVERNSGASLIDLGHGVVCCEFHAKMNAIGADLISMIHKGLKRLDTDFEAMVIANQAVNFSVGANLMLVLVGAQEQEWDELHMAVKQFQNANLAIKYARKPVVVAPQGMALGGGCEISLHGARIQAAAESYMGLVEAGVGLIPGGGGTKEMLIRANERAGSGEDLDLFHALRPIFEAIATAKVGTSVEENRELGFLRREDGVSMNSARLIGDAKEAALSLVRGGWKPLAASWQEGARTTQIKVLGESFLTAGKLAIHMMQRGGFASDYDAVVGRKLANILAGGALSAPQMVSEQYVLDLEREAFVSLLGEKKTQERIAFTLKTGKPLRN